MLVYYIIVIRQLPPLSTVSDRAFPVAAARVWNSLLENVTLHIFRGCVPINPVWILICFAFHILPVRDRKVPGQWRLCAL